MHEVFPVVSGLVVGLAAYRWFSGRMRIVLIVALSLLLGLAASFISGELAASVGFVAIDAAQVLAGAIVGGLAYAWWQRSSIQTR